MKQSKNSTVIHIVRHGHVRNPNELFYGRLLGFPLCASGREQAHGAMEYLRRETIAAIYSSPQLRARETAEILMKPHEASLLNICELLDEVHCPFDGKPLDTLQERNWDVYTDVGPEYEQPGDVLNRILEFVSGVRRGHDGQNIVAVSHGDPIAFMILWSQRIPCTPADKQELYDKGILAPASVTTFSFDSPTDEMPSSVKSWNPETRNTTRIVTSFLNEPI